MVKVLIPDKPSLKDIVQSAKTNIWKKAIKVKYKAILANVTWVYISYPKHNIFLLTYEL